MPVTLRRRLQCHYCGKRLNTAKRQDSKINCDCCLADNYFDENNNVIDVPASVASASASASAIESYLPEVESESESDIFCRTCLNNQSFYVRALADYLPDDDDPRYEELESALPEYKKELDLRYPPCCPQCEPRVQSQIQHANYAAKSDHLRRLLHRKHHRRHAPALRLRSLLITAAGLGQVASLAAQILWHALSSQATSDHIAHIAHSALGLTSPHSLLQWPVPAECTAPATSLVPPSLALGLLCIWWNPRWQHRLMGKDGRLVGLRKYYVAQLAIMALRFLAWAVLKHLPGFQRYGPAVHTICLGLLTMLSVWSWFGVITLDTTPLVDWHQVQARLVHPDQFRPPIQQLDPSTLSQPASRFSIESLAGPAQNEYEPWRPPTPPTSEDSMDWTPTRHLFNPQPKVPKPKWVQPSPFHGALPAAPLRGSLNPKRPAPAPQKKALGLPPGFFGLSKSRDQSDQSVLAHSPPTTFAPAKFFAHEREADTGLENIFDKMFSVRDPLERPAQQQGFSASEAPSKDLFGRSRSRSRSRRRRSSNSAGASSQPSLRMLVSCLIVVALAIVASSLCSLEIMYGDVAVAPSTVMPYTALLPLLHMVEDFVHSDGMSAVGAVSAALHVSAAAMAYLIVPQSGSTLVPMWNKMILGVICLLLLQEIYHFCQLQSTPVTQAAAAQMVQSMEVAEQQLAPDTQEIFAVSHPSPQPSQPSTPYTYPRVLMPSQPQHAMPAQMQRHLPDSIFGDYGTIRKRDSDESISSVSSIQSTSTVAGWRTPRNDNRTLDWQNSNGSANITRRPSSNISRGLGGLSLGNDFGAGAGIAGPRNRQAQGSGHGRYR